MGVKLAGIRSAVAVVLSFKMRSHVLLACRDPRVCTLRQTYSDLFGGFSSLSPSAGTLYAIC